MISWLAVIKVKGNVALMVVIRLGDSALIFTYEGEEDSLSKVLGWSQYISNARLAGVYECLPCYRTLTVFYDRHIWRGDVLAAQLSDMLHDVPAAKLTDQKLHEIPVCYDGEYAPDIEFLSNHVGLSVSDVITLHSSEQYTVAGLGFSPGFGFLKGLAPELICPRRSTPRLKVPRGAVGIANDQTGVYPSETAGGWNLIGQTPVRLIDFESEKPSLLQVGDQVRFVPISEKEFRREQNDSVIVPVIKPKPSEHHMRVLRVGGMTTVQDLGRVSYRDQGFPSGGAMDRKKVEVLNHALGNDTDASVIEFCRVGLKVEFITSTYVMVGGSLLPELNGVKRSPWSVIAVHKGDVLDCGVLSSGSWGYLAIQGGFEVPELFASSSTHPHLELGGYGGRCLAVGDEISFSPLACSLLDGSGVAQEDRVFLRGKVLRCVPGAQWDWFSDTEHKKFLNSTYAVSEKSNRVGYFLEGERLVKTELTQELTSEGACPGAIQITNLGQPVVLMPDAQSIGGYPKIACILKDDLGLLSQLRPGERFQFQLVSSGITL